MSFIIPFRDKTLFFVGEAGGLYLRPEAPSRGPYLRPATPPKFDGDAAFDSLRRIGLAIRGDEILCYAHWGASSNPREMISLAAEQTERWMSVISTMRDRDVDVVIDHLVSHDPLLARFSSLPEDMRERERIFIRNSVRGFIGYIKDRG
jgi:hypothetical protein